MKTHDELKALAALEMLSSIKELSEDYYTLGYAPTERFARAAILDCLRDILASDANSPPW